MTSAEHATQARREDVIRDFDRAANVYDEYAVLQRDICREGVGLAQEWFPANGRVLDIGCGTGFFSQEAQALKAAWDVVQLDLSPAMCRRARQVNRQAICADATALPLQDKSANGAFSSLMLQWVSEPAHALAEMVRVLKPGSRAVLITFGPGTLEELRVSFEAAGEQPRVHAFISLEEWAVQAKPAGLEPLHMKEQRREEHYPSVQALIENIRAIGAASKRPDRRQGSLSVTARQRMEAHYQRRFATAKGIRASWNVLTLVLEKKL